MDSDNTEKYSLRPRNSIKKKSKTLQDSSDDDQMGQNANNSGSSSSNSSSSNSSIDQQGQQLKRVKPKPPPLSKYRRKTANARERSRMHEINVAFETLRQVVPHLANIKSSKSVAMNEKLTKITTLRLAMRYIRTLNDLLKETDHLAITTTTNNNDSNNNIKNNNNNNNNSNNNNGIETPFKEKFADLGDLLSDCSELDCLLMESDGESLTLSEQSSLLASSNSPNFSDSLSSVDFDDPTTLLTCNDFVDQPLSVCEFNELFLV